MNDKEYALLAAKDHGVVPFFERVRANFKVIIDRRRRVEYRRHRPVRWHVAAVDGRWYCSDVPTPAILHPHQDTPAAALLLAVDTLPDTARVLVLSATGVAQPLLRAAAWLGLVMTGRLGKVKLRTLATQADNIDECVRLESVNRRRKTLDTVPHWI